MAERVRFAAANKDVQLQVEAAVATAKQEAVLHIEAAVAAAREEAQRHTEAAVAAAKQEAERQTEEAVAAAKQEAAAAAATDRQRLQDQLSAQAEAAEEEVGSPWSLHNRTTTMTGSWRAAMLPSQCLHTILPPLQYQMRLYITS